LCSVTPQVGLALQLVEALRPKTVDSRFVLRYGRWKFSCDLYRLSTFSSLGVHSTSNRKECQGIFLRGKVRPTVKVNNSAILLLSNVKVRMEAQHSILPLSLRDLLRKPLPLPLPLSLNFQQILYAEIV